MVEILRKDIDRSSMVKLFEEENISNLTVVIWRNYMKMVDIFLDFLRAEREVDASFSCDARSYNLCMRWTCVFVRHRHLAGICPIVPGI